MYLSKLLYFKFSKPMSSLTFQAVMFSFIHNLKVTQSIVRFIIVYMMDYFIALQCTTKILFHDVTVLLYSFSPYIYSQITITGKVRFIIFFCIVREIVVASTCESCLVSFTDFSYPFPMNYSGASTNGAFLS